ncbi:DUF5682 family protein [Actinocorallia populi]|uniref:DUF5682 family protein n=1 Tax=Actinocorallia populi TaxID=2079200 RepID=UPI000D08F40A
MGVVEPREAVGLLAECGKPFLVGVRHHSPAVAAVVPALLEAAGAEVVCVELPADFQRWIPHLGDAGMTAPVALAGTQRDGGLGFYPFADFSPELAAIRWARERGVPVVCCDLPLADPGWAGERGAGSGEAVFAGALAASGTGRDGDDLWDRAVEVLAPGCSPEAVRRAALGVGWALRQDAERGAGVAAVDLAREAYMRGVLARVAADGRRVAAVVGSFHAPALVTGDAAEVPEALDEESVTSLVPYAFDLLDARSGYPAGIRDPRWQQEVFQAGGDPAELRDAAARAITGICRAMRDAGHTAGTGEAAETLRVACDLALLRGLPAPGRGELVEAVSTVLGQGEPLGRGRAVAKALEQVLVGTARGRLAPGTPRSGLGPSVERELAELRLPCPDDPDFKELRLDPLRSALDRRRETLLQRLDVCGVGYGERVDVGGTGDGTALSTRWRVRWTPSVPARLDLVGVRGVTAAQAAAGTLSERFRHEAAAGGPTCAQLLGGLETAARCDLPDLVAARLADAAEALPSAGTLPELIRGLDLLEALRREHLPGTTPELREQASGLAAVLLEAAVRALPGLAGSDDPQDATALVDLATRAGEHRLGLRLDDALDTLARTGSPMMSGTARAVRVLLDLDDAASLGSRVAGWIDTATTPEIRTRLHRRLAGLLTAAGPLLENAPAALDPLIGRIETLSDRSFLVRLPALRGGFNILTPAARGRLLETVTARLGDRPDLALDVPAPLLALWTTTDSQAHRALQMLDLPAFGSPEAKAPEPGPAGKHTTTDPAPIARSAPSELVMPSAQSAPSVKSAPSATSEPSAPSAPSVKFAPSEPSARSGLIVPSASSVPAVPIVPSAQPAASAGGVPVREGGPERPSVLPEEGGERRLGPADRWRLLLGRESEKLSPGAGRYGQALDELYGAGKGEGAADFGPGGDPANGGGREESFPTAREWAAELEALFGADVCEEVLAQAADAGRTDVLTELNPDLVRPSIGLLTTVLSLAGGMPEQQLAKLRPLVKRLVDELAKELATRMRPTLTGLATPRPTRRPGGKLDLQRTLRANLAHTRELDDGRRVVVPENPVFTTRASRQSDWRLILVVDVSGSMEASVIWSALTAAVLGGVPTLSTHFLTFSTEVIDLTERVDDPLSLLLEVRVGGGTHIARGLAHARSLVTVPSRTLVVVVSDFEEGYGVGGLLAEVRTLVSSGVHLLGCAALDDTGAPRYSKPIATQLAAAGMPVAALSPQALARWVGARLRGEAR